MVAVLEQNRDIEISEEIRPVVWRLRRDLSDSIKMLDQDQVRYLVDMYYQIQHYRIQSNNQKFSAESEAAMRLITFLREEMELLEEQIKATLDRYAQTQRPGRWLQSIYGIGPVLSSGFLAHLDITQTETAGGFWRFAGLDPTSVWSKGEKRPWNADLKVLCWKAGTSFWKFHNRDGDFYGHLIAEKKLWYAEKNERGEYADQAKAILEAKKIGKDTEAHKHLTTGKLPPGQIQMRALRWGEKLFLSHLHHVMYECHYGKAPPKPYVLNLPNHTHEIRVPNWPIE